MPNPEDDPFDRPRPTNLPAVEVESGEPDNFEIERLESKITTTRRGKRITQYRVKWLG